MNNLLLQLKQVQVKIHKQLILDQIDLAIYNDQIITIIGPNGAGKTTLLKTLLGLIKPSLGQIYKRPNLTIGYVPQKLQINLSLPLTVRRFLKLLPRTTETDITQAMTEVGAVHILDRSIHSISGGELQRTLLARALLRKPELLVLDEPTQGVDINGQVELYQLINQLRNRYHCGVIMVSHDLNLVMSNTDQVICLNQHICCSGHPQQVSHHPAFIELFGDYAHNFAIYHHHHDHQHSPYQAISNHQCKGNCHHA